MIWLTWRQFRAQAIAVYAAIAALTVILAITGPKLARDFANGAAACDAVGGCNAFNDGFFDDHVPSFFALVAIVMLVPGIIGLFWGAPLLTRELEAGTHQLAWNQSITRSRWLAIKLGLMGVAAIAAAGLGSLVVSWWSSPLDEAGASQFPRLSPLMFDGRGIAPVGYAAFALVLGVTVGMLIRRTIPAIAVTLILFAIVQIVMPVWVRPNLIAPIEMTTAITAENLEGVKLGNGGTVRGMEISIAQPGAWIISNQTVDATGKVADALPVWAADCISQRAGSADPAAEQACLAMLADLGYRQLVTYQPGSRFWTFQWYETAVFIALALMLSGFCFWWIRRLA